MEEIDGILNDECVANNDIEFCSLYYNALKLLIDIDDKANVSYLFRYMTIFENYYDSYCCVKNGLKDPYDIIEPLKCSLYYRFFYVFRNATLFSSATASYFRKNCKQNPNIIKRLIMKKRVKLCSIGGHSASDIVAVITVLKSIAQKIGIEFDFRVTIIDSDAEWKNTCFTLLNCLEEFNIASWKMNFVQCDFTNKSEWTPEMLSAIQEADVILSTRHVTNLTNKMKILELICEESKKQAMIFIIDHTVTNKVVKRYFECSHLDGFHLIHVELCGFYGLDTEAVRRLRNLYRKHFGPTKSLQSNVVFYEFVGVWVRASSETDAKHKKNMQSIFQINVKEYNPKQDYLTACDLTKENEATGSNTNLNGLVRKEEKEETGSNINMNGLVRKEEEKEATGSNTNMNGLVGKEEEKEAIGSNTYMNGLVGKEEEKESTGSNTTDINDLGREEEENRSNMSGEFIPREKRVHALLKDLPPDVQSSENEVCEINLKTLEHNFDQKWRNALIQKTVYLSSLCSKVKIADNDASNL